MVPLIVFLAPFAALVGLHHGWVGAFGAVAALAVLAVTVKRYTRLSTMPWVAWPATMAVFLTVGLTLSAVR